ncbi:Acyl-CoA thioesterase [Geodermatophilus telluris]|uniref:Acyl-CoA thioesterase n=1 Tax=Geodermatophilus telluris TaxID=1190417 RepID=A0A1G6UIQ7_9ACTN|nr:thioesterase family protein [Geodermatophilus telluris]SDD41268.1 Acyl-CoA thioesterase [Geodermatophilus telluris]
MDVAAVLDPPARVLSFDPTWRSFTSTQGGLVVGSLLAAAAAATGSPPRTVTAHLLAAVVADTEAAVEVVPDRTGTTGSVRATLSQEGRVRAVAQVLTLARPSSPVSEAVPPVPGPTVREGVPFALPRDFVPVAEHTEIRALGTSRPLAGGPEPRLHAWVRVDGGLEPLVQLGVLADALPPALFAVRTTPAVMPTVELTAHLAGPLPASGDWVRVDQRLAWTDADLAVDDAELRTVDGALVARVRQTRRLLSR